MLTTNQGGVMPLNDPNMPGAVAPVPSGGAAPGGDVNSVEKMLAQLLKSQAVNRTQVMLPQQVPPAHVQAGDVSGNFVNPSTIGGPKHNARVTMAQSIGTMIAGVENQYNQKKARDVAYDVQRIETAMNNPSPENIDLVNTIMYKHGNPAEGLTPRGKAIQEALNINLMGDDSKTKPHIKQARQIIFGKGNNTGINQQGQLPGQQQPIAQPQPQQIPQNGAPPQQQPAPQPQYQKSTVGEGGQVTPGNDAYGQLQKQFPTGLGLSPEAQINAQAIQLGLSPKADTIMNYLKQMATDENKWNIATAVLSQKDRADFMKAVTEDDRFATMKYVAELQLKGREATAGATVKSAGIRAGAENERSDTLKQIADSRNVIKVNADSMKQQLDNVEKQINSLNTIAKNDKLSKKERNDAKEQADNLSAVAEGLRNSSEQLRKQYNDMGSMITSPAAGDSKDGGTTDDNSDYKDLTDWLNDNNH